MRSETNRQVVVRLSKVALPNVVHGSLAANHYQEFLSGFIPLVGSVPIGFISAGESYLLQLLWVIVSTEGELNAYRLLGID